MKKTIFQIIYDFICMPFRLVLLPDSICERLGLTSLRQERVFNVLPHVKGRLIDIGCGDNMLVNIYSNGLGVDNRDLGKGAVIIKNVANLPFEDHTFDTVTFVASLNHIVSRKEALSEARRLLKPDGRLIVTMIGPIIGAIAHLLWWYSEDKHRGGMKNGEVGGMTTKEILRLCLGAGFQLKEHQRIVYKMNNIYIFELKNA
ncbi:MAG: class I SAM-dependent methyltransferase [Candidatus Gorgyraea atricola]|nr:class I SAM-dependent methyltransferase [Candidatus Gorgyraea atricola]